MKKSKIPDAPVPRQMDEIQKVYSQALAESGNTQYLIFVYQDQLAKLNDTLLQLNNEAAQRKQIDAEQVAQAKAE